jgi:hypothetical protein
MWLASSMWSQFVLYVSLFDGVQMPSVAVQYPEYLKKKNILLKS